MAYHPKSTNILSMLMKPLLDDHAENSKTGCWNIDIHFVLPVRSKNLPNHVEDETIKCPPPSIEDVPVDLLSSEVLDEFDWTSDIIPDEILKEIRELPPIKETVTPVTVVELFDPLVDIFALATCSTH